MKALVVGGDGKIGSALVAHLIEAGHEVIATTRRAVPSAYRLDLSEPIPATLPKAGVVYLVAAMPTFAACEGSAAAWIVNVDAPVEIAQQMAGKGTFVVFISSDAVEWCGATAYARMKAHAETIMHTLQAAIVRPSRVTPEKMGSLCALLERVGEKQTPGVYRWS